VYRLAYNTNGLAHHRVLDALRLCAELGYEGVALTPDVGALDPLALRADEVEDTRRWAQDLGLELAIETGARFVLDARRKHHPTLLAGEPRDRARRVDFYRRCVELATRVDARVLSLWSGANDERVAFGDADADMRARDLTRLAEGLAPVLALARDAGVQVAFEPEPGMFIERPSEYDALCEHMGAGADELGLTLDVGHLLVTGDLPVGDVVRRWAPRLVHVHLDDIAGGVHEHRMFGTGDLDLEETLSALIEVGYDGMAAVELSRDSHRGADAAAEALVKLRGAVSGKLS
jgi:sugar phosphate isomerase/epimerase